MKNIVKQKLEKIFSDYMIYNVKHYQKKYGFDMDNNSTHNNEADAFKNLFRILPENIILMVKDNYEYTNCCNSHK